MAIPIVHEGQDVVEEFGNLVEQCHFCKVPTRYWHENTNNPVCPSCAKVHKVAELPDHGQAIRALKRKKNVEVQTTEERAIEDLRKAELAAARKKPRMRKPTKKDRVHSLARRSVESTIELIMLQLNIDRKEACAKIKQMVNEVAHAGFSS